MTEINAAAKRSRDKESKIYLIGSGSGELNGVKIVGNILHDSELNK